MLSSPDSKPVVLSTTTNVTTLTIELQPLADYLVRVSAHTSAGAGPWSWPLVASSSESVSRWWRCGGEDIVCIYTFLA